MTQDRHSSRNSEETLGPCSCQDEGKCRYVNGGPACMNERQSQKCPHCQEGWQHPSAERPGRLVCNICGRYDGSELPKALYVWLVPSEEVLDQPGSWRIRKWDTEPFPEATHQAVVQSESGAREAARELSNIANAERFNRERFRDDTEFADWAQSRCRHTLSRIE
jgi:hypothetical protein